MSNPIKLARRVTSGGAPIPLVAGNGARTAPALATSPSAAEVVLPSHGGVVIIRALDNIYIKFGLTGLTAAAADANSTLFLAGETPYVLPTGLETHFRALRVGGSDVLFQIEGVATVA